MLHGAAYAPGEMHIVLLLAFAEPVILISSRYVITKSVKKDGVSTRTVLLSACFFVYFEFQLKTEPCLQWGQSVVYLRHLSWVVVTFNDLHGFCNQFNYSAPSAVISLSSTLVIIPSATLLFFTL